MDAFDDPDNARADPDTAAAAGQGLKALQERYLVWRLHTGRMDLP